jgi:hypothetical protein
VILDRRRGDRRRVDGNGVPGPERRREDRRRQKPAGGLYVGTVVPAGEPSPPAPRPRAATPTGVEHEVVTAACATCWDVLSFELPRFPKPPARLDAEVIHERGPSSTQHYAEIQAFTISGRRLLVQRVQAVRQKT